MQLALHIHLLSSYILYMNQWSMKEQQDCNSKQVTLSCVLLIQTLQVVGLCFSDLKSVTKLHACIIPIENGVATT